MCGVPFEWQITELVDDQQLRLGVVRQPFLQPPVGVGLGELGDEDGRRREQHRVARHDRFPAHGDRQMRLVLGSMRRSDGG